MFGNCPITTKKSAISNSEALKQQDDVLNNFEESSATMHNKQSFVSLGHTLVEDSVQANECTHKRYSRLSLESLRRKSTIK